MFLLTNWKLILSGLLIITIGYFIYDYRETKENYLQLLKDYDKTVEAYEDTIKIVEAKTRENAISEEKAKNVQNSIIRLEKLKGKQSEVNNDNIVDFVF